MNAEKKIDFECRKHNVYEKDYGWNPVTCNSNYIIDSCYYLLLSEKVLSKTKAFITISLHKYILKMSNKVKDISIKNKTCYFFNYIINIENFDLNNIKIDEKSYKNVLIDYIGYVTIKEYLNVYNVNPLNLIFRYIN